LAVPADSTVRTERKQKQNEVQKDRSLKKERKLSTRKEEGDTGREHLSHTVPNRGTEKNEGI
jgi:hypothetical protein